VYEVQSPELPLHPHQLLCSQKGDLEEDRRGRRKRKGMGKGGRKVGREAEEEREMRTEIVTRQTD
jgi:hypothetical protein